VALSGGRVGTDFFLRGAVQQKPVRFIRACSFFLGDERCVPPDDPESNFRLTHELFLSPLGIREDHVIAFAVNRATLLRQKPRRKFRRIVPLNGDGQPMLDLISSCRPDGQWRRFPRRVRSIAAASRISRGDKLPKPPPRRITIGFSSHCGGAAGLVLGLWRRQGSHDCGNRFKPTGKLTGSIAKVAKQTRIYHGHCISLNSPSLPIRNNF